MANIAELKAVIGADTSKLKAGLLSAKKDLAGFGGQINNTVKTMTGFNLAQLGVAGAAMKIGQEMVKAVNETQAYNLAMIDMARKMGTSTEEASRLVQVGDDVRLSQEQISTAMTYAIRNGIQPSIAGISKLADQYVSLKDPVEKGQLLLKSFGRSGMEMGKLLEQGGAGIQAMAANIEEGLIVTEEAAQAAKDYYKATDDLNDAWTALKITFGNAVIPTLTDVIDGENDLTVATYENIKALEYGIARQEQYGIATNVTTAALDVMRNALVNNAREADYMSMALAAGVEETGNMTSETMALAVEAYNAGEKLTREQYIMLGLEERAKMSAEEVHELDMAMTGLKSKEIWITTFMQTVKVSGFGYSKSLNDPRRSRGASNAGNMMDYNDYAEQNNKIPGGATGLDMVVPAGHIGDTFPVMAKSGERVQITPTGQSGGGGGDLVALLSAINSLDKRIGRAVRDALAGAA